MRVATTCNRTILVLRVNLYFARRNFYQLKEALKVIITNVYEVSLHLHVEFYIASTHIRVVDVEHACSPI